jgi:hypothetical protein
MAETALPAADLVQFLDQAARFANDTLWGTLSATVLIDPRTRRDPGVARALARAVAQLRYGTVAVNVWHVFSLVTTSATWGSYPGQPDTDIQSGRGLTGNTLMLPDPENRCQRAVPDAAHTGVVRHTARHAASVAGPALVRSRPHRR